MRIMENTSWGVQFSERMSFLRSEVFLNPGEYPLIIYGAGAILSEIEPLLLQKNVEYVITDSDPRKHGYLSTVSNKAVIAPQEIVSKYKDKWFCISVLNRTYYNEILQFLLNSGVSHDRIISSKEMAFFLGDITSVEDAIWIKDLLCDEESYEVFSCGLILNYDARVSAYRRIKRNCCEQYFDPQIIRLRNDEIFLDCGGYIGDTVEAFIKLSNNNFKSIFSFEPIQDNINKYSKTILDDPRIYLYKSGLGGKPATVNFDNRGAGSWRSEDGSEVVHIETIDRILDGKSATFIKMDIEGSELDALHGAEQTICKFKPKLAICVYHRDMDVFNITKYLKKCVPDYKFFLRHYSDTEAETVLYATID